MSLWFRFRRVMWEIKYSFISNHAIFGPEVKLYMTFQNAHKYFVIHYISSFYEKSVHKKVNVSYASSFVLIIIDTK
jgi:hypothetical protein